MNWWSQVRYGFTTCLADDGRVLADARVVTAAADVLAEDPEGVLVAHDQVGHGAAGPAVVLVDGEPLLEAQRERAEVVPLESPQQVFLTESWSHLGLQVGLLYRVARDLAVAVVFGRLPLQGDVEAPDLCDGDLDRRPRLVCEQRVGIEVQQVPRK